MGDPVLFLIVGPNGAGKTEYYERALRDVTHLPFVNADAIAQEHWPHDVAASSYRAGRLAAEERRGRIAERSSFITETVFSHPSKVDLCRQARAAGYLLLLHVILVPEDLAVARVAGRVRQGGHAVPEEKIRQRYRRLWPLVRQAIGLAHEAEVFDNSRTADSFRSVARFEGGTLVASSWPSWTPSELRGGSG